MATILFSLHRETFKWFKLASGTYIFTHNFRSAIRCALPYEEGKRKMYSPVTSELWSLTTLQSFSISRLKVSVPTNIHSQRNLKHVIKYCHQFTNRKQFARIVFYSNVFSSWINFLLVIDKRMANYTNDLTPINT